MPLTKVTSSLINTISASQIVATEATAGQVLTYNGSTSTWVASAAPLYTGPKIVAWAKFSQTVISESYNVASVTVLGTGNYRVNFTTPLASANYGISVTPAWTSGNLNTNAHVNGAPLAASFNIYVTNQLGESQNTVMWVACFQ